MSFTFTLSVRIRTVLVCVVEISFSLSISMENILQSLVKIIIIGSLFKTAYVDCNQQFLPPPLPYYPNGNFFIPGFGPPYHEPLPVYYREENPSPSFQSMNSYTSPQLFHQNENYSPLHFTNPTVRYSTPQIFPLKPNFYRPYKTPSNLNSGVAQVSFKKPLKVSLEPQGRPTEATQKRPAFYATNIIIKEESQPPYYSDDYNKNYQDEDYSDNYSDESLQPNPCIMNSPYRYFEPPKSDSNNPNMEDKHTLCTSYFQPNFGNDVYTMKMPLTLLPSRFPPRVEQLIERIQNYFSTYTHQETPKPQNQNLTTTTLQPTTYESEEEARPTTENLNKNNITVENQDSDFEQINLNPSKPAEGNDPDQTTQKTTVAIIQSEKEEKIPTMSPDIQDNTESQAIKQSKQTPLEFTEIIPPTTETFVALQGEFPVGEQQPKRYPEVPVPVEVSSSGEKFPENQNIAETETRLTDVKVFDGTTESVVNNKTEEVFTSKKGLLQFNVTGSYG